MTLLGQMPPASGAVLLIGNHMSWWDGFFAMYLNHKIIKRKFHFMMREDQLRKHRILNYAGGFSINKHSRSMLESLIYCAELLSDQSNLVTIFPQGKIQSMHHQAFTFEKGIERLITNTNGQLQIVFTANMIDYFSQIKPSVYIYFETYSCDVKSLNSLEHAYNQFYRNCVAEQQKRATNR